jgi:hypothetical protein
MFSYFGLFSEYILELLLVVGLLVLLLELDFLGDLGLLGDPVELAVDLEALLGEQLLEQSLEVVDARLVFEVEASAVIEVFHEFFRQLEAEFFDRGVLTCTP